MHLAIETGFMDAGVRRIGMDGGGDGAAFDDVAPPRWLWRGNESRDPGDALIPETAPCRSIGSLSWRELFSSSPHPGPWRLIAFAPLDRLSAAPVSQCFFQ